MSHSWNHAFTWPPPFLVSGASPSVNPQTLSTTPCSVLAPRLMTKHPTPPKKKSFPLPRFDRPFSSPATRTMGGNKSQETTAAAPPPAPRPRQQTVLAENVFEAPGRQFRPEKICVILRGLPGSGKSHVARLLRDLESVRFCGNVDLSMLMLHSLMLEGGTGGRGGRGVNGVAGVSCDCVKSRG